MTADRMVNLLLEESRHSELKIMTPEGEIIPIKRLGLIRENGQDILTVEAYRPNVKYPAKGLKAQKI